MRNIIEVKSLTRKFNGLVAVDDVSFTVRRGELFGFLGPNGAGKTTTMRMIATLLKPTSGRILLDGLEVGKHDDTIRSRIGFAMQGVTLDSLATAEENLILMGVLYGMTSAQARARATELLKILGLDKVARAWVKNFSGGMKRRLDLAGVLMHEPTILFLDEPTEGLDPAARRLIWNYLKEINGRGVTIFLTTHYMDEAGALCDRLAIIDHGKIVAIGTPAAFKKRARGSLEDAFIKLTGHGLREEAINTNAPDPFVNQDA